MQLVQFNVYFHHYLHTFMTNYIRYCMLTTNNQIIYIHANYFRL